MTARFPARAAVAAATAATLIAAPAAPFASADAIDDTLAKLPSGPISCAQAERYWTNEADYNNKVRQAQAIARFDRRGPQILAALGRVDEAATRCGLKGGGAPANRGTAQPAPAQPARPAQPAQPSRPANQAPAPANQAPAPANQAPAQPAAPIFLLAPPGAPSFEVPVNGVGTLVLPDILEMIRKALADILNYFNVKVPGIN